MDTLELTVDERGVAVVTLNRPDKHNAMDAVMIRELTEIAGRKAIVPQITGRAWITGEHSYYLDPTDPYPQGYVLSDTWGTSNTVKQ